MRKSNFIVLSVAAAWIGTVPAHAQTHDHFDRARNYEALFATSGDVATTSQPSDMKVMGLSVPNGFNTRPVVNEQAGAY